MTVVAKVGMLDQHGKVRTAEGTYEVRRSPDGWYTVPGPAAAEPGRLRYDDERDVLDIERPGRSLSIRFRPELERTTFELNGHTYDVGTMDFGNIAIKEGGRSVVQGHVTVSGVRLVSVDPELQPFERELAFGLALRSDSLSKSFWREDEPFLEGFKEGVEGSVLQQEARLHHDQDKPQD